MRRLSTAALLLAPLLSGCFTAQIAPGYRSRADARPGAASGAVYVSVPAGEVPIGYSGVGGTQSARATRSLNDFLRETLSAELRAMGYAAAQSQAEAKGVLSFAFTKAFINVNGWNGAFDADVRLKGDLKDAQGRTAWSAELAGAGHGKTWAPGMPGDLPQTVFNQALAAALDQFAPGFGTDPAVAALLGGAAPAAVATAAAGDKPSSAASQAAPKPVSDAAPVPVVLPEGPQRPALAKHGPIHLTLAEAEKELLP